MSLQDKKTQLIQKICSQLNLLLKKVNSQDKKIQLIVTVGGASEPIIKSIKEWKPKKLIFIYSQKSKSSFEKDLTEIYNYTKNMPNSQKSKSSFEKDLPSKLSALFPFLEPQNIEDIVVDDPEDIKQIVQQIKKDITPEHKSWIKNGDDYISVLDITGGTKCMSASLALVARSWKQILFSYVGGERGKGGVGTVKTGDEKVVKKANPWELFAYQTIDEAILFFNDHKYSSAYNLLDKHDIITNKEIKPIIKKEFCAAKNWFEAYKNWDNFDHNCSYTILKDISDKKLNDLKSWFSDYEMDFEKSLKYCLGYLNLILKNKTEQRQLNNSLYLIFDLILNAKRKARQGQFDDAIARLYRAIEAMAQYQLEEKYNINSANIQHENLTDKLKKKHPSSDGNIKLALQESYCFLIEKKDPLGKQFKELNLSIFGEDNRKNPLTKRNQSILAHGFDSLSQKDFDNLSVPVCKLFSVLKETSEVDTSFIDFKKEELLFPKIK